MEREQQPWSFMASFNWPPRSYSCSFCKREFRSAQALGGHMNVHRRDRARLRHTGSHSPPPPPQPPANASSKAPAALAKPPPPVPNLNYPPPLLPYHRDGGKKRSWTDDVSTGLGVGLLQSSCTTAASSTDPAVGPHPEDDDDDDLDLELRLGVS